MPNFNKVSVEQKKKLEKENVHKRVAMQKAKEKGRSSYLWKGTRYAIN